MSRRAPSISRSRSSPTSCSCGSSAICAAACRSIGEGSGMDWSWLFHYFPALVWGLVVTLELLVLSMVFGMVLAVPIGLVQVTGPWFLSIPARTFCTIIRGTPLLIQVWLLYYG